MTIEMWRAIPGFAGYEVSNWGQVKSYRRRGGGKFHLIPHLLKPAVRRKGPGYRGVNLRRDGQSYFKRVARLVLLAFVGPCPSGMEVCHNNSNPGDDRLENLRYDTTAGNMRDRLSLSDAQVIEIRERRAQGESIVSLAQSFNIKPANAYGLCRGRTYRCVGGPFTAGRFGGITTDEIIAMRIERANSDITLRDLGKKYGISASYVSRICGGEYYPDTGGPIQPRAATGRTGISIDDVMAMRIERANNSTIFRKLGEKYGVTESTAWDICNGRTYADVSGPITAGRGKG